MSFAHCNPDLVEKAADAFRDARETVPSLMERVEGSVCALAEKLQGQVNVLASNLAASRTSGDGFSSYESISSQLDAARQRLATVQRAKARLEELVRLAGRIDTTCDALAKRLDQVAMLARDVARGGMPEPNPRRSSATSPEIQRNLNDVLNSAHVSSAELPPLPTGGPGAPDDPRDEIHPTDSSNWWER